MPKISSSDLKAMIPENANIQIVKFKDYDVRLKVRLMPQERIDFVNNVIAYCSSAQDKWEAIFDLAAAFATIEAYTDVKLPKNMNTATTAFLSLDLVNSIFSQCEEANDSRKEMVNIAYNYMLSTKSPEKESCSDKVLGSISFLLDTLALKANSLDFGSFDVAKAASALASMTPNDWAKAVVENRFDNKK